MNADRHLIAVGIGLGVDCAIYMMDRIKEEMRVVDNLQEAVKHAVSTTGVAIASAAMFLVPAWVDIFKPKFIMESRLEE